MEIVTQPRIPDVYSDTKPSIQYSKTLMETDFRLGFLHLINLRSVSGAIIQMMFTVPLRQVRQTLNAVRRLEEPI